MTATWIGLLRAALVLLIIVGATVLAFVQAIIPPIVIFLVLFLVALYLLTREGRARTVGIVLGGLAAILFLLGNLPFVLEDIAHPESMVGFATSVAGIVGAILGLVAMIGALRGASERPVRPLLGIGAALVVLGLVVGAVATFTYESDDRQAGDVALVAEEVDYIAEGADQERDDLAQLALGSGDAVFVDNKDLFRHTFVIEELDIEEEIPAGASVRVVVDAEPGDYEFICDVSGHEDDMKGTLTVR